MKPEDVNRARIEFLIGIVCVSCVVWSLMHIASNL